MQRKQREMFLILFLQDIFFYESLCVDSTAKCNQGRNLSKCNPDEDMLKPACTVNYSVNSLFEAACFEVESYQGKLLGLGQQKRSIVQW